MQLVKRTQWGAPVDSPGDPTNGTRGVKIHYLGLRYDSRPHSQCAAQVLGVYRDHLRRRERGRPWVNIGYNFLVCEHGYVFEGRGLRKVPAANGEGLNRAHYAVCGMIGDTGSRAKPTDAMLHGLVDAIELLRAQGGAGNEVLTHQDGYKTSCPGPDLVRWVRAGARRPGTGQSTATGGAGATVPNPISPTSATLAPGSGGARPLSISAQEMNALAAICILEGPGDLTRTDDQLQVAGVLVNRLNSSNWTTEFGPTMMDQLFARNRHGYQFEVISRWNLSRDEFARPGSAGAAVDRAKGLGSGSRLASAFVAAVADPRRFGAAIRAIGGATGFRGGNSGNRFTREGGRNDAPIAQLLQRAPTGIVTAGPPNASATPPGIGAQPPVASTAPVSGAWPPSAAGPSPSSFSAAPDVGVVAGRDGRFALGQEGEEIKILQALLGMPPTEIDGKFGGKTRAAVLEFQRKHGLKPPAGQEGQVGPITLQWLLYGGNPRRPNAKASRAYELAAFDGAYVTAPALANITQPDGGLRMGHQGESVKEIQALLGMPPEQQDGYFGTRTRLAVLAFQARHGLRPPGDQEGQVGPTTLQRLRNSPPTPITMRPTPVAARPTTAPPRPPASQAGSSTAFSTPLVGRGVGRVQPYRLTSWSGQRNHSGIRGNHPVRSFADMTPHWNGTSGYVLHLRSSKFKVGWASVMLRDPKIFVFDIDIYRDGQNERTANNQIVRAAAAGTVERVGGTHGEVAIRTPSGHLVRMLHNLGIKVRRGQQILFGQEIGNLGSVGVGGGALTNAHIHLEALEDICRAYIEAMLSGDFTGTGTG